MSDLPELPDVVYAFAWVDHNGVKRLAMLFDKDAQPMGCDDKPVAEYIRADTLPQLPEPDWTQAPEWAQGDERDG